LERCGASATICPGSVEALFKDFAAADTDGDGKLSIEEIDIYIRTNRRWPAARKAPHPVLATTL